MISYWVRYSFHEAELVAPYVDMLDYSVGHCSPSMFTVKIKGATAFGKKLGKKVRLWQLLFKPTLTPEEIDRIYGDPSYLEENLQTVVGGLGVNVLTGVDCETYNKDLRATLDQGRVVSPGVHKSVLERAGMFDYSTPQLFSKTTVPRMSTDYGLLSVFPLLGRKQMTQAPYRNWPGFVPTINPMNDIGIAVHHNPPNHEHTPAEALEVAKTKYKGCNICFFPAGTNDVECNKIAEEFAKACEGAMI